MIYLVRLLLGCEQSPGSGYLSSVRERQAERTLSFMLLYIHYSVFQSALHNAFEEIFVSSLPRSKPTQVDQNNFHEPMKTRRKTSK